MHDCSNGAPLARAVALGRTFGSGNAAVPALRGVTLSIERSRLTVLKGRSGSGKTTLLNILGGLDLPTTGKVFFKDQDLTTLSEKARTDLRLRQIGFVFQSFGLMPLYTALENVELPLRFAGEPARERRTRAERWLEYVGLKDRMDHRPYEMSGGEQQRTAIARALAQEPALILADEPTAALDIRTSERVVELLKHITRETGVGVCLTTHDPALMQVADTVYGLADGCLIEEA